MVSGPGGVSTLHLHSSRFSTITAGSSRGTMSDTAPAPSEEAYVGQIKGGLRPAMRIVVMGIIHKQPKSMMVTLSCPPREEGDEERDGDVGLQLTVKFPEKAVVRTSRINGKWGTTESIVSFFPFAAGESFKMEIVCEHQQFRILVDGQPLCGFTHRVTHLASLTTLRVGGDLQLTKIA